ncbi:MAG TPA: hypothetical protein VF507_05800, partial [Pyrinomonadaceae bacterium]
QREALARRATVYTVGLLIQGLDWLLEDQRKGRDILNQLATSTGGLSRFPQPEAVSDVLEAINADSRNQYVLSYYPPVKAVGWRRVRVSIPQQKQVRLSLRYQERYLMK